MKILFSGNKFKYEVEATVKLFIPGQRFEFIYDCVNAEGDIICVRRKECKKHTWLLAFCRIGEKTAGHTVKIFTDEADYDAVCEHELCRCVYFCLMKLTRINPVWGLLTGIRPVKKMTELLEMGFTEKQAKNMLKQKYMVSDKRLDLAYDTAVTQLPLLDKITSKSVSLYISIPFCPTRCSYCSFVSHSMDSARKLIPDYVRYLCRELEIISKIVKDLSLSIDTIYFGGGTPTSIEASQLKIITDTLSRCFNISDVREYNVEAGRADTITREKLEVIKAAGATRISVNPQTLNDSVLKTIGRNHTAKQTVDAFYLARRLGFNNINMDLISGLPTDTSESFKATLDKVIEMNPESITVHTLTIKRSAGLYENAEKYITSPAAEMTDYSIDVLPENGYRPYYLYRQKNTVDNLENIGFSKPGCESLYNIFIMDETQTILGAGCAASTKLVEASGKITRIHNYKFPYEYINRFDELMKKKSEIYSKLI